MIFCKFLDNYSISECGKVRNDKKNKLLTPQKRRSKSTHLSVCIRGKNYSVSRLVAYFFVCNPNPEKYTVVNHIDNNPLNNHHTNLEWTDQKGNMEHCKNQGRHTCDNNEEFKKQVQEKNKPSKTRKPRKNGLPLGVYPYKTKKGTKYHARITNSVIGYINLGSYDSIEEAYEKVKDKYFEVYGQVVEDKKR